MNVSNTVITDDLMKNFEFTQSFKNGKRTLETKFIARYIADFVAFECEITTPLNTFNYRSNDVIAINEWAQNLSVNLPNGMIVEMNELLLSFSE